MKLTPIFIVLFAISSCEIKQDEVPRAEPFNTDEVIYETDFGFNKDHPNAEHFNWMLNNFHEEIYATEIDWVEWKGIGKVQERFSFRTSESGTQFYLIFCATQNDCISVCSLNFEPTTESMNWGVNGAVAFVVMNEDQYALNDMLGYLAGEE